MKRAWWGALALVTGIAILLGGCGGSSTPANNPTPIIANLFPSNITAGSQGFSLQITATSGLIASVKQGATFAYWNGSARSTTYNVVTNQLQVAIPASDVAMPGTAQVTLWNPPPGGGMSQTAATFTIVPVAANGPTITDISPTSASVGGANFTLTVTGTNFAAGNVVTWNGVPQTTSISGNQATAAILSTYIANVGSASIAMNTTGVIASPSVEFAITGPNNPMPAVKSISPASATAGSPDFEAVISGSGFTASSVGEWNGVPLPTAYISGSKLIVLIPAANTASAASAQITVTNPPPGGGTSGQLTFTVSGS